MASDIFYVNHPTQADNIINCYNGECLNGLNKRPINAACYHHHHYYSYLYCYYVIIILY